MHKPDTNINIKRGESIIEKYLMSEKTLEMWIKETDDNTYKGCPIEIDNSIPYGGVEHIED